MPMTLRQLLTRFALAFIGVFILAAIAASMFDIQLGSYVNTAALLGASMYACGSFSEKNGRRLTADEGRKAWMGMLAIDLGVQFLFAALLGLVGAMPSLLSGTTLLAFAFVGLLHALALVAMVKYAGHLFDKQQTARARKAAKAEKKARAASRPPSTLSPEPVHGYQNTVPMELR